MEQSAGWWQIVVGANVCPVDAAPMVGCDGGLIDGRRDVPNAKPTTAHSDGG